MNLPFELALPGRILIGTGEALRFAPGATLLGRHAFWVTGSHPDRWDSLRKAFLNSGISITPWRSIGEPTSESIEFGVRAARDAGCDCVIAVGGGSVIDSGKAIAALAPVEAKSLFEYLEVVGNGQSVSHAPLPWMAIPTTAGAGAEATRNAVLRIPHEHLKVSLRSASLLPRIAIVDALLTCDLPDAVTAATGFDALTQLIEPYLSRKANPFTDALCRTGIPEAVGALKRLRRSPRDIEARSTMSRVSLWGGMALANAGLGAVHGFAAPIGGMFNAPHGVVCAALLPGSLATHAKVVVSRVPDHPVRTRLEDVGRWITGKSNVSLVDAALELRKQMEEWGIPRLRSFGIQPAHHAELISRARSASSMKGNPLDLTDSELAEILESGC